MPRPSTDTLRKVQAILRAPVPKIDFDGCEVSLNMASFASTIGCKTTACIAGMCAMIDNPNATVIEAEHLGATMATKLGNPDPLRSLFFVENEQGLSYMGCSVVQDPILAAEAIENYITGHKTPWGPILDRLQAAGRLPPP